MADERSNEKSDDCVLVRQFRDLPEALLAKGMLDSAGIESFLGDENTVRMDWFWSNAIGGVKLSVRRENADAARNLLAQSASEEFDVEGIGNYEQPRCPKCQSLDVSFQGLNRPLSYATVIVQLPVAIHRRGGYCNACGHTWQPPSETPKQDP